MLKCIKLIMIVLAVFLFSACTNVEHLENESAKLDTKNTSSANKIEGANTEKDLSEQDVEEQTPSQLLRYLVGNASEFSFSYKRVGNEETGAYRHFFKDNKTALFYDVKDIDNKEFEVCEIEKDDRVYYVIQYKNKVISYKSPASDVLLFEMQKVCLDPYSAKYHTGDYVVFEYKLPFAEDDNITLVYRFYMLKGGLKKLEVIFDPDNNNSVTTYYFSEFCFDTVDDKLFEIPEGLSEVNIDSELFSDDIPPWWE